jgi:hypothetical protein
MAVSSRGKKQIAHTKPKDRDWNPGQGRDGAQHLDQRMKCHIRAAVPSDGEAERHCENNGQSESPGNPE